MDFAVDMKVWKSDLNGKMAYKTPQINICLEFAKVSRSYLCIELQQLVDQQKSFDILIIGSSLLVFS